MTPRVRWIAERDGEAHAHVGLRATRTACDSKALSERHAWPIKSRCATCTGAVAALAATAGTSPAAR